MSDKNQMNEIMHMLTDSDNMRSEVFDSMKQVIYDKYVDKINSVIKTHHSQVQSNPSKEIRFLSLMKEFMPKDSHDQIENIIDLYTFTHTYDNLKNNLRESNFNNMQSVSMQSTSPNHDESVHNDGIYDVDTECVIKQSSKKVDALSALMMMMFVGAEKK